MKKIIDFKDNIDDKDLLKVKDVILNDGIVVFPTETVYGIGANIYSDIAVNKIFIAKGRPNDNPLIVHISNVGMLDDIVIDIDVVSKRLMDEFWPGPLTIILPKKDIVSDYITAGLNTVGVRMPSNLIALKVIEACGVPIAAPSANISGKPSGTNISDIYDELMDKVDLFIDGGNTEVGIESTVVTVINNVVHILRPGRVTKENILELGLSVFDKNINEAITEKETPHAPGMKYRHYAPETDTILVYSSDNDKMVSEINSLINDNKKVIIIGTLENKDKYKNDSLIMGSKNDLLSISHNVFAALREADRMEADLIIVEGVEPLGIGSAIMNRLRKACSNNYIEI